MRKFSWRTYFTWMYFVRCLILIVGLFLYSVGLTLMYRSNLGLGPWDVLHQGISFHTPLSFGTASIVVGALIIACTLLLKVYPGVGTLCNMILIGSFVDMNLRLQWLSDLGTLPWLLRLAINVLGVLIVGMGTAFYIVPRMGSGPRDGLMIRLHQITGMRVAIVRGCIELCALLVGYLLGGTIGIGTLLFAFGIGPAIEFSFNLLKKIGMTDWLIELAKPIVLTEAEAETSIVPTPLS